MGNALPLDLLIDITSTSVKDAFTIGKLNTLLITKYDDDIPNPTFTQITNLQQAQSFFGYESDIAKFAAVYFGFISKTASKCDYLFVYNWSKKDLPATLKGGVAKSLQEYLNVNGGFALTISGVTQNVEVDLTDAGNQEGFSYSIVAEVLQDAINALEGESFKNAKVEYIVSTRSFVIKSGLAGETETIGFLEPPLTTTSDSGTTITPNDISNVFGLTASEGALSYNGANGKPTLAEALAEINDNNGNYYVITPNFAFDDEANELKAFGEFLNASNDRFCGVYSWDNPALAVLGSGAAQDYEGYNGLIIDYKVQDFQNALICSFISGMDLSKPSGNYNIAFNDATTFQVKAITDRLKYEGIIENKANAPCKFGILGQDDAIYMDGTILGNKTSSINIYVCNSFLKFNQQIQLYNMFKSQKIVGIRGSQSRSIIYAYLDNVFQSAINSGIIAQDVDLSVTEQQSIISIFGMLVDDINIVIEKLQSSGYYYILSSMDLVKREIGITEAYIANTPAKRIVINNYILGA